MRKTDQLKKAVVLALVAISFPVLAQVAGASGSAVKSSIVTVDQLIKKENEALLRGSQPRPAPSLGGPAVKPQPVAPTVVVESIYGAGGALKADLLVNGQERDGVGEGAVVQGCVVRRVVNKCVSLAPANRSTSAAMCPTACWTGESSSAQGFNAMSPSSGRAMAGQPMPAPLPMGSVSR